MKFAVIAYGPYREFDTAVKYWDFLNYLDCDVYVSTWSNSKQENSILNIKKEINVTEEMILKYIPNAKIQITDESKIKWVKWVTDKMIYHWKTGMKMVLDNDIKYDMVILMRLDTIYYFDENRMKGQFHINTIHGIGPLHEDGFINDTIFMGDPELMKDFIFQQRDVYNRDHYAIGEILKRYSYENLNILAGILRPNIVDLKEDDFIFEKIMVKFIEWNDGIVKNPYGFIG